MERMQLYNNDQEQSLLKHLDDKDLDLYHIGLYSICRDLGIVICRSAYLYQTKMANKASMMVTVADEVNRDPATDSANEDILLRIN